MEDLFKFRVLVSDVDKRTWNHYHLGHFQKPFFYLCVLYYITTEKNSVKVNPHSGHFQMQKNGEVLESVRRKKKLQRPQAAVAFFLKFLIEFSSHWTIKSETLSWPQSINNNNS